MTKPPHYCHDLYDLLVFPEDDEMKACHCKFEDVDVKAWPRLLFGSMHSHMAELRRDMQRLREWIDRNERKNVATDR